MAIGSPYRYNRTSFRGRGGRKFNIGSKGYRQDRYGQDTGMWISPTGEAWHTKGGVGNPLNAMTQGGRIANKDWNWYEKNLGLQRDTWKDRVNPWDTPAGGTATFGQSRAAMRRLGFEGDWGGGRGGAFRRKVGQKTIDDEIAKMNAERFAEQQAMLQGYGAGATAPAEQMNEYQRAMASGRFPGVSPMGPLNEGYLWDQNFTGRGGNPFAVNQTGQRVDQFGRPTDMWISPTGEAWNTATSTPMTAMVGEGGQMIDKPWSFYQDTYGLDPNRWEAGINPWDTPAGGQHTFGQARAAMRNLGFQDDFGEGRGAAFRESVGQGAIDAEIARMNQARLAEQQEQGELVGLAKELGYGGGFQGTQFQDWLAQNPAAQQAIDARGSGAEIPLGLPGPGGMGSDFIPTQPFSGNYSLEQDMAQYIPYLEPYTPMAVPDYPTLSDQVAYELGNPPPAQDQGEEYTKEDFEDMLVEALKNPMVTRQIGGPWDVREIMRRGFRS